MLRKALLIQTNKDLKISSSFLSIFYPTKQEKRNLFPFHPLFYLSNQIHQLAFPLSVFISAFIHQPYQLILTALFGLRDSGIHGFLKISSFGLNIKSMDWWFNFPCTHVWFNYHNPWTSNFTLNGMKTIESKLCIWSIYLLKVPQKT